MGFRISWFGLPFFNHRSFSNTSSSICKCPVSFMVYFFVARISQRQTQIYTYRHFSSYFAFMARIILYIKGGLVRDSVYRFHLRAFYFLLRHLESGKRNHFIYAAMTVFPYFNEIHRYSLVGIFTIYIFMVFL